MKNAIKLFTFCLVTLQLILFSCSKDEIKQNSENSKVNLRQENFKAAEDVIEKNGILVFKSKAHFNEVADFLEKSEKIDYFVNKSKFKSLRNFRKSLKDEDFQRIAKENELGNLTNVLRIFEKDGEKHITSSVENEFYETLLNENGIVKVGENYFLFRENDILESLDRRKLEKYSRNNSEPANDVIAHEIKRELIESKIVNKRLGQINTYVGDGSNCRFDSEFGWDHNIFSHKLYVKVISERHVSNGLWTWWAKRNAPSLQFSFTGKPWTLYGVGSAISNNKSDTNCDELKWTSNSIPDIKWASGTCVGNASNTKIGGGNLSYPFYY